MRKFGARLALSTKLSLLSYARKSRLEQITVILSQTMRVENAQSRQTSDAFQIGAESANIKVGIWRMQGFVIFGLNLIKSLRYAVHASKALPTQMGLAFWSSIRSCQLG